MSDARALILAAATADTSAPVEGFPGAFVKHISITDLDNVTAAEKDSGLMLLRLALVDQSGKPLFTEADMDTLGAMPVALFRSLMAQVTAHNQMGVNAVEALEKN